MSDVVSLPSELARLWAATFVLIEAPWADVWTLTQALWANASRDGWLAWRELPCRLDPEAVDRYAGRVQAGVLGPAASGSNASTLRTSQADGAASYLAKLAQRLRCRVVSTTFCDDWDRDDAVAALVVLDGRSTYVERWVRVMRNDNGRLEYIDKGPVQEFEDVQAYAQRALKDRLSTEVLQACWRRLGLDLPAELDTSSPRRGIAFVHANRTPVVGESVLLPA